MNNIRAKLMRFMYGRYGMDQLTIGLIIIYFILFFVNVFTRIFILDLLMWAVLIWSLFRSLSRNIHARQKENRTFLKFWNPVRSEAKLLLRRLREGRTYRFRRCSRCRTILRLPRRTGKLSVRCPRCQNRFQVRIFF